MMLGRLVLETNGFEVEMTIEKLTRHKLLGIDQIPGELIKAGGRTVDSEIHKLSLFEIRRNCLSCGKS